MKKINIPENVKSIDLGAFLDCSALKRLDIPNGLTAFGKDVFSGCPSVVIHTQKGSLVERYAMENSIKFKSI